MKVQVGQQHYQFDRYVTIKRWASLWHQLNEVMGFRAESLIEIGPGPGLFKSMCGAMGVSAWTLDIDARLLPDIVGLATDIPLPDRAVDLACAFQVLEHMPFDLSMSALREMCRVARDGVIISLPDARTAWPFAISVPKWRVLRGLIPRPFFRPAVHEFDGEHYWEINKKGFSLEFVTREIERAAQGFSVRTFRVHENPYHRFFVLKAN